MLCLPHNASVRMGEALAGQNPWVEVGMFNPSPIYLATLPPTGSETENNCWRGKDQGEELKGRITKQVKNQATPPPQYYH